MAEKKGFVDLLDDILGAARKFLGQLRELKTREAAFRGYIEELEDELRLLIEYIGTVREEIKEYIEAEYYEY